MRMLRWSGDAGVASFDGVTVVLREPPVIDGMDKVESIDYVPNEYAEFNGARMTSDHHKKVDDLLRRMAVEARDVVTKGSTLVIVYYGADR
jgi:hypothetical protein